LHVALFTLGALAGPIDRGLAQTFDCPTPAAEAFGWTYAGAGQTVTYSLAGGLPNAVYPVTGATDGFVGWTGGPLLAPLVTGAGGAAAAAKGIQCLGIGPGSVRISIWDPTMTKVMELVEVCFVCPGAGGVASQAVCAALTAPVNYCQAGITWSGCQATVTTMGRSSASQPSGFFVNAWNVEGSNAGTKGIFFYGFNGRQANPWGVGAGCTSFQCVVPPVRRCALKSGGGTTGSCDACLQCDLNAQWTLKPSYNPGPGAVGQGQFWFRDPNNACTTGNQIYDTTAMSEAVEWLVGF
jgi:hypothetical protein